MLAQKITRAYLEWPWAFQSLRNLVSRANIDRTHVRLRSKHTWTGNIG